MKERILITPSSFGEGGDLPFTMLCNAGYEVVLNPFGRKLTEDETIELFREIKPVGMIAGVEQLNARVLEQSAPLKVISRCGSGMESVDCDFARARGITVANTPDGPTRAVAELTIALVMDMLRKISFMDRELHKGKWQKQTGRLLQGRQVGIVGLGRIGRKVAELMLALDANVAGNDLKPDYNWANAHRIEVKNLQDLLKESEILCLHVSSARTKKHLIGRDEIYSMPKGSYLVNISRGDVLDEGAVYQALTDKHLAGAALDVFSEEPYNGPLKTLDNAILTPHIGSYARETRIEMERQAVENLLSALKAGS